MQKNTTITILPSDLQQSTTFTLADKDQEPIHEFLLQTERTRMLCHASVTNNQAEIREGCLSDCFMNCALCVRGFANSLSTLVEFIYCSRVQHTFIYCSRFSNNNPRISVNSVLRCNNIFKQRPFLDSNPTKNDRKKNS